jgi:hypothetical protein
MSILSVRFITALALFKVRHLELKSKATINMPGQCDHEIMKAWQKSLPIRYATKTCKLKQVHAHMCHNEVEAPIPSHVVTRAT